MLALDVCTVLRPHQHDQLRLCWSAYQGQGTQVHNLTSYTPMSVALIVDLFPVANHFIDLFHFGHSSFSQLTRLMN